MDTPIPETSPLRPPEPEHKVTATFPSGDSNQFSVQYALVSVAQIELLGHFLIRQAEKMYAVQDQVNAQRQPIIPVPAGAIDPSRLREGN
jgi:hypothetical protein